MSVLLPSGDRVSNPTTLPSGRLLVHVPVVHSAADLGSLAHGARERLARAIGKDAADRRIAAVHAWWRELGERIDALTLDWKKTRLYQDGLPVCEHEMAIVTELAHKGNPNHAILLALVARGATLMGTEDAALIVAEYRRFQKLVQAEKAGTKDAPELRAEGEQLLRARDAFIAARVDATLRPGESGVLFLGAAHRVAALLADKMVVQLLDHHPPSGPVRG